MLPVHTNPSRMGIEQGLRGDPHRGPGYNVEHPASMFLRPMNSRPRSIKGYGFGAARSKRPPITLLNTDPGPADYQSNVLSTAVGSAYQPFLSAQLRFKERLRSCDHLGPGSHDHDVATNRKVDFEESFGGPRTLRKAITTKCTKGIPDQCSVCKTVPVGDYYEHKTHHLCRTCYAQLSKTERADGDWRACGRLRMKKVRDCSGIHKHDFPGRPPKTVIVPEKEQKKLQYREAYLSLYYS